MVFRKVPPSFKLPLIVGAPGFLVVFFLSLLFLPLLYIKSYQVEDLKAELYSQVKMQQAMTLLEESVRETKRLVWRLAQNPYVIKFLDGKISEKQEIEKIFINYLSSQPGLRQLRLLDPQGKEIVSVQRSRDGALIVIPSENLQDKSQYQYFLKTINGQSGEVYVSELNLNRENQEIERPLNPVVRFSSLVTGSKDKKLGIVIINKSAENIFHMLENYLPTMSVYVANNNDEFVHHPDKEFLFGKTLGTGYLASHFIKNSNGDYLEKEFTLPGETNQKFKLLLFQNEDSWGSSFHHMRRNMLLIGIVFLLISVTGVFLGSRKLIWRVRRMIRASKQFASGSYTLDLGSTSKSEFGVLENNMVKLGQKLALQKKKLVESKDLYRSIFQTIVEGIVTINEKGKIQTVNQSALKIFGYEEHELIGKNVQILMPSPHFENHDTYLKNYLKTGESKIIGIGRELDGKKKDGTLFPIYLSISVSETEKGRIFTGVIRDETERRKMMEENQSLIEQKLQASRMASLGTMVSGICHEINNPLTVIKGIVSAPQGMRNPHHKKKLATSLDRVESIIDSLKKFSQVDCITDRAVLNLEEAINEAFHYFEKSFSQHNIDFIYEIEEKDKEEALIMGNFLSLSSVFENLFKNSLEAFKASSRVERNEVKVKLRVDMSDMKVIVCYRDNAGGVPQSLKEHIFDPFFTTKEIGKGRGLGLSICYGIVKDHLGVITLEESDQYATQFKLVFPLIYCPTVLFANISPKKNEELLPKVENLPLLDFKKYKLLLVDDEPDIVELLQEVLEEKFSVVAFLDPKSALESLKKDHYDLVLTDLSMAQVSGIDLFREAKKKDPKLKVVLMSGYIEEDDVENALKQGLDGYLKKPFGNMEEIAIYLQTLCCERKLLRQEQIQK